MATDIGTGTTITFGTSSWTGNITGVNWSGISREAIQTSHMGTTTAHTFMPADLFDPGELSIEVDFEPDDYPPIDQAAETITVTFPSGATWAASGFCTGFDVNDPLEDKMTATMTIKFSGDITDTDAP